MTLLKYHGTASFQLRGTFFHGEGATCPVPNDIAEYAVRAYPGMFTVAEGDKPEGTDPPAESNVPAAPPAEAGETKTTKDVPRTRKG